MQMFIVEVARICAKLFKAENKNYSILFLLRFYPTSPEANS